MTEATRNLLEQHFDTALAAPDGIAKLRELILMLAMQGKLVEQDSNDPPASELLKEIDAEKQQLTFSSSPRRRGSSTPLPPIKPEEVPYDSPPGWEWVRLGDIGDTNIGLTYSPSDVSETGIPVLRSNNIQNGNLDLADLKRVNMHVKESVLVQDGDLLICARNGSRALVGKTALITGLNEKMAFGAFMAIFRSRVNLYLLRFINSPLFRRVIDEVNTMTINQITQNNLRTTICPLPPLPEQHRIVTRIDQLMARCDKLEKLRKEREEKRLAVHAAAIKQLLDAPEGSAWNFIEQHFGELYTVKENVAELRKAILQLAVMGRLVPQDASDPPASELLKAIEAEKQRSVKAGKIKKPRLLPPIKPEEVPYELPQGWEWVRLGDITEIKGGKRVSNGYKLLTTPTPFVYIRVSDMKNGTIDTSDLRYIDENMRLKIERYIIQKNDIYMTIVGATIGKCGTIPEELDGMNLTENAARLILYSVDKEYLHKCLESDFCQEQFVDKTKQVGVQKMALARLASTLIPLPPLPEQLRIVTGIEQLTVLCDTLDQQIDAATGKQNELLNAMMARV